MILAAIPTMLPACSDNKVKILDAIIQIVSATGRVTGLKAERLTQIEKLFNVSQKQNFIQ